MPSISVCIAHVYPERRNNIREIVDALYTGSMCPTEVIVWNNEATSFTRPGVKMIHAVPNPGPCARFLAGLCATSDYVFFQGTDCKVEPHTLEHMHSALLYGETIVKENFCIGLEGRLLTKGQPYYYSMVHGIDGRNLQTPTHIDIAMGRMEIIKRDVMNRVLSDVPLHEREDDIWFSAALAKHGVKRIVIPYTPGLNGFTNINEGGVGNCRHGNHMQWRDDLCKKLFPNERG